MDSETTTNECGDFVVVAYAEEVASTSQSEVTEENSDKLQDVSFPNDHCGTARISVTQKVQTEVQDVQRNLQLCKFYPLGCQFQGTHCELEKHEGEKIHNDLLIKYLLNLQTEQFTSSLRTAQSLNEVSSQKNNPTVDKDYLKVVIDKKDLEIDSLKKEVKENEVKQNQKLEELNQKIEELRAQNTELKAQNTELKENCETISKQQTDGCAKLIKFEQDFTALKESHGAVTQLKSDVTTCKQKLNTCRYVWKVEKFTELQRAAKTDVNKSIVYSDVFYSTEFGYKLRGLLYPLGNGQGKGTHLSVFLQVMKGEFDEILKWPMEYSAEIKLLDQLAHKDHCSRHLKSNLSESAFPKPIMGSISSWGCPTVKLLDELKPLHLIDDCIFLEINLTVTSS